MSQGQSREPGDEIERQAPPNPRGWAHNNQAGVEMSEHREPYERWLKFRDGKPPQEVIDYMKDNGFRWHRDAPAGGKWPEVEGAWALPVRFATQTTDRLVADRTYFKVVEMMLAHKGIEASPEQSLAF